MLYWLLTWQRAFRRDDGQDMVEYALLLAMIATGLLLILAAVAGGVGNLFNRARDALVPTTPFPQ